MITKKQVKDFIIVKRNERQAELLKDHEQAKQNLIDDLLKKNEVEAIAYEIYEHMQIIGEILSDLKSCEDFSFSLHFFKCKLENLTDDLSSHDKAIKYVSENALKISYHPDIERLKDKQHKLRCEVMEQFDSILANITHACKNGKEAKEYVDKLGFDTHEIQEKTSTALMAPVDISKLFSKKREAD